MAFMGSDSNRLATEGGESMNYFPTHNFYLPTDSGGRIDFRLSGNSLFKNDLAELNVIAANHWKRPIAFTYPPYQLGLNTYVQNDGLTYSLTPVRQQNNKTGQGVNIPVMYTNLMTKFKFGGAEKPGIYFDENGRRELMSIRHSFTELATALATSGSKDSALRVLNYGYKMLDPTSAPYGMVSMGNSENIESLQYAYAFYLAGDTQKGDLIGNAIIRDCQQQIAYYNSLSEDAAASFAQDRQSAEGIMRQLSSLKMSFAHPVNPKVNP
jgi:hypothetical protein